MSTPAGPHKLRLEFRTPAASNRIMLKHLRLAALVAALCGAAALAPRLAQEQGPFDVVITGGRVIDPESGLDGVRHVGIRGGRIAAVSERPLSGLDVIDARGLVVSPGFIDLHRHAVGDNAYRYAVRDGVTTALELEIGTPDVDAWYRMMGPARLINFGVGAGHIGARMQVKGDKGFLLPTGPARQAATSDEMRQILDLVDRGLRAGGIAVGVGIAYTPGVTPEEIEGVLQVASRHDAFVHTHLGGGGVATLNRLLDLAVRTRTSIHIAHVNSSAGVNIAAYLDAVKQARSRKQDVTTEMYPYTAGASLIQSSLYDDWEKWPDARFADLQWAATGERLTRATFAKYRAQGGSVISHSNTEDNVLVAVRDPLPLFASDGGRDLEDNPTHPRAAGTFARILGRYVREAGALTLTDALRRMTIEPARRLEARVPEMRDRGRLRVGAHADITVFDPATVLDQATYTDAAQYPTGIRAVVVNGVPVVRDGDFDARATMYGQQVMVGVRMPGRPIRAAR
jgi:N-acyl-D-aspartate/D-glutamate deacylase